MKSVPDGTKIKIWNYSFSYTVSIKTTALFKYKIYIYLNDELKNYSYDMSQKWFSLMSHKWFISNESKMSQLLSCSCKSGIRKSLGWSLAETSITSDSFPKVGKSKLNSKC